MKIHYLPINIIILLVFSVFASENVNSQSAFKCVNAQGKMEYSDRPCNGGQKQQQVEVSPNSIETTEFREQILREENQTLREQLQRVEQQKNQESLHDKSHSPQLADMANSLECQKARRSYQVSASSIKPNSRELAALRSAMYGTCGQREPDITVIKNQSNQGITRRCTHDNDINCIKIRRY